MKLEDHLNGERVAKLIFTSDLSSVREKQIFYSGNTISNDFDHYCDNQRKSKVNSHEKYTKVEQPCSQNEKDEKAEKPKAIMHNQESASIIGKSLHKRKDSSDAVELLLSLPGFREGKLE